MLQNNFSLLLVAWASSEQARSLERWLLFVDGHKADHSAYDLVLALENWRCVKICWGGLRCCAFPQVLSPVGVLLFAGCVSTWVTPACLNPGAPSNGHHGGSAGQWRPCLCAPLTSGLTSQSCLQNLLDFMLCQLSSPWDGRLETVMDFFVPNNLLLSGRTC